MADLIIKPTSGTGNKLILQNQAGNAILTTGNIATDTIFPAGMILQVVPFTSATATNVTSATTWVSIPASSVTIISRQANSKFLYHFDASVEVDVTSTSQGNFAQIARNGTKVTASNQNVAVGSDSHESSPAIVFTYTDSPLTAIGTTITYTIEVYRTTTQSWQINQQNLSSQPSGTSMNSNGYVMEIAV
jgi:hypothetical protein